jgi:hypothetical protein
VCDEWQLLFRTKATATVLHPGVNRSGHRIESTAVSITTTLTSNIQREILLLKITSGIKYYDIYKKIHKTVSNEMDKNEE